MVTEKAKTKWFWIRDLMVIILIPVTVTGMGMAAKTIDNQTKMIITQTVTSETLRGIQTAQASFIDRIRPLELWKAETSANRFTKSDGYDLAEKSSDRDAKITEQLTNLANIVATIPKEISPFLIERIKKLEDKVDVMGVK